MSSEITLAQVTLFMSGIFLLPMLASPPFGFNWVMSSLLSLVSAAVGFRSLRHLWRSDDARRFLRSSKLLPILSGALAVSFAVGSAILFWDLTLVGLEKVDLFSVDASATFGFSMVILSLVSGFVLSLLEAVWRARQELP